MKKRLLLVLLLSVACAVLCGCFYSVYNSETVKDINAEIVQNQVRPDTDTQLSVPAAPVTVSPLARQDFLEPVEDFSWEREFPPEYVVLHFTSAVVLSPTDPYNMDTVRGIFENGGISIHYIIDRDGKIFCYIPEDRAAWHAGKGTFGGDSRLDDSMNKYSVGIEMLAVGSQNDMSQYLTESEYQALDSSFIGFTDSQYDALKALVRDICERNSIPFDREHVIGHEMYNPQKCDPGELFDWTRLFG